MPPTVLCIDDQPTGLQVRKIFLESMGYSVLTATTGRDGLQTLKDQPVDAVILDYRMPEMDGAQVASEIRKTQPELPIVLLSGYIADIPTALREQVNGFVAKGSPPEDLLGTLDEVLGSRPAHNLGTVTSILHETRRQATRAREHLGKASSHLYQSKKIIKDNKQHIHEFKQRKG